MDRSGCVVGWVFVGQFPGWLGVSGQFKTWCVRCVVIRYGLRMPILIIETRLLWYLSAFRNEESESLAHSFHAASWVYFEFRKKRIYLELEQRCWTNGSIFFLPFYAAIVSLTHQLSCACFIPSHRMDPSSPYGSTMRGPNLTHSTGWMSGTADSPAPVSEILC